MLPFEFIISGPPVSLQTKNKRRLQRWKNDVRIAAERHIMGASSLTNDDVKLCITYYYDGSSPDVDNIIKPIQDALIGVVYNDDSQVVDTRSRKKSINGSYKIKGASKLLLNGFANGCDFLHVQVILAEDTGELD